MGSNLYFGCNLASYTFTEFILAAEAAMKGKYRLQHADINVSKLVDMHHNEELRKYVVASDVVCVDGMGALWACRALGARIPERVSGVDIMGALIGTCERRGYRPYFLGARPDVVSELVLKLRHQYPKLDIAGYRHGYFIEAEEEEIVTSIRESGADCLFVGMSSPKKEAFLYNHRDALGVPVQIGVGGSFDVLAGRISRAPKWMQKSGLEWFHRFLQEPRRLGPRYLKSNAAFIRVFLYEFQYLSLRN